MCAMGATNMRAQLPRLGRFFVLLALGLAAACSGDGSGSDDTNVTAQDVSIVYVADFGKLNESFPSDWPNGARCWC